MATPAKALTRRHNPDCLEPFPEYVRLATETVALVSVNNDMHNRYVLHAAIYPRLRGPQVNPAITRGCTRRAAAAAAKNIDGPERAPTVRKSVPALNDQKWRPNPVGEAYVSHAYPGTRQHPRVVTMPVSGEVGELVSERHRGDLWPGRDRLTITHSKEAPVTRGTRESNPSVAELTGNIDHVGGEPQPITGADMSARGCMAGEWTGNGRFGRPMRQRLQSSAMIKFQTRIGYKARWVGADAVFINPRNTSTLSCVCSGGLGGKSYAYPACAGRVVRVDGDVNAVLNARRTTPSVARYGRAVRPSRDEAQRTFDVIPCPGVLARGGRIFRVDDRKAIPGHNRCHPRLTGTTMPPQDNRTLITRPLQRYA